MNNIKHFRHLLVVLLVVSLGILLVNAGNLDRGITDMITTSVEVVYLADAFLMPYPNAIYAPGFVLLFLLAYASVRIRLPQTDPFILPVVALLTGVGLIMILRLSPDLAIVRSESINAILSANPDAKITHNITALSKLCVKYFGHLTLGVLMFVLIVMGYGRRTFVTLSSKKYLWVALSVGLIILTIAAGQEINGRRQWFLGIQPVELVKLLMLLFIAGYLYEQGKGIALYSEGNIRLWMRYGGAFVIICFFALIPLCVQKDLGSTIIIFIVYLLVFFYAGNRNIITLIFCLLFIVIGFMAYHFGYPPVVRTRFDSWLDPFNNSEIMVRVLWSLASGGWFGTGLGYGEPFRISEVQSDFTFVVICEELGFVGGGAIILAYMIYIFRCFRISQHAVNQYEKYLVIGIGMLMTVQVFVIILGNLCVIPLTGVTLPFISYGGSSLVVNFIMLGLVVSISGRQKEVNYE